MLVTVGRHLASEPSAWRPDTGVEPVNGRRGSGDPLRLMVDMKTTKPYNRRGCVAQLLLCTGQLQYMWLSRRRPILCIAFAAIAQVGFATLRGHADHWGSGGNHRSDTANDIQNPTGKVAELRGQGLRGFIVGCGSCAHIRCLTCRPVTRAAWPVHVHVAQQLDVSFLDVVLFQTC